MASPFIVEGIFLCSKTRNSSLKCDTAKRYGRHNKPLFSSVNVRKLRNNVEQCTELFHNNIRHSNPKDIVSILPNEFSVCFTTPIHIIAPTIPENLFSPEITLEQVLESLSKAKKDISVRPDDLSNCILINAQYAVSKPLLKLFDLSQSTGFVPDAWRTDNVTPLHKGGPSIDPGNYISSSVSPALYVKLWNIL